MTTNLDHRGNIPLETDRLLLRCLDEQDAQKVFDNWTSDAEVTKYLRWNTHSSVEITKNWTRYCKEASKKNTFYDWGIIFKETGEPIGSIGAFVGEEPDRYEVGYVLGQKYWNQGIASEALRMIVDFLNSEVGVINFCAVHAFENPASGAVMRHVGFKYVKDGVYRSFDGLREFQCKVYYLDLD